MSTRRDLTDDEKAELLSRYGMRCFIANHPIESEKDLEFDHIVPVSANGPSTLDNMAPVCKHHNRRKGTMSLLEYRDYLELETFFADGAAKYLDDVIRAKGYKPGTRFQFEVSDDDGIVTLYFDGSTQRFSLYTCPTTNWPYFYALIPIQVLNNDIDLQPRPLRQASMWGLYRHFQQNTQLAPSNCRIDDDGRLLLFDGQHKAAAQIWAGRQAVECKVYIQPDPNRMKETNLEAHQSFRQMSFYSSELMKKYADIFHENWEEYVSLEGRKSEKGFLDFLVESKKMSSAKARQQVLQAIYHRILNDPENKLAGYTSEKTRARQQPLTYNRIEKTLFRYLLSPVPSDIEFETEGDLRSAEEHNLVRIMSIIAEEALIDSWNPELNNALHRRTERIFSAGSVRAWTRIFRDVLNAYLQLYLKGPEEVNRVLYRQLTEDQFTWIRRFLTRIFTHPIWDSPDTANQDISKALTKDDDTTALNVLQNNGLTVQWVLESAGSVARSQ